MSWFRCWRRCVNDWPEALAELSSRGFPVALVTVVRVDGSTPRDLGAKMLVTREGRAHGSIGGGKLELLAIEDAQAALRKGETCVKNYPLCIRAGQCCGGNTEALIEVLNAGPLLYLFGAGHVGQALCNVLRGTAFTLHLVDPRPEWLESPGLPKGVVKHSEPWQAFVEGAEWSTRVYAAVLTHSHDMDCEIVADLVQREAAFIGLIGSRTKWSRFQSRLKEEGIPNEQVARIHCPIGMNIGNGKAPQEVAISIAAQLLQQVHS